MHRVGPSLALAVLFGCQADPELRVCTHDGEADTDRFDVQTDAALEQLEGCRVIEGRLNIGGTVSSLEPLHRLEVVESLAIIDNRELVDLHGLESLHTSAGLTIAGNERLVSLEGLSAPAGVKWINVRDNAQLRSLVGLEGVELAGSGVPELSEPRVVIEDNPKLEGFDSLRELLGRGPTPDLTIGTTQPFDLDIIAVRPDYNRLVLDGPGLHDFEALRALQTANWVSIGNSDLRDLSALSEVRSLRTLSLHQNANFESMAGFDPSVELVWLSLWSLPTLSSTAGFDKPVSFYMRLDELPLLDELDSLRLVPDIEIGRAVLTVRDCPVLTQLPSIEGTVIETLELQRTGLEALDDLAGLSEVTHEVIIWDNPNLSQADAES